MNYLYKLVDPRTGDYRYVGKSNNPDRRLAQHINKARRDATTYRDWWILSLLNEGLRPEMEIVTEFPEDIAWEPFEEIAIHLARLHMGEKLTNHLDGGEGYPSGEAHPRWKPKTEVTCKTCGFVFEVPPNKADRRFCSDTCRGADEELKEKLSDAKGMKWIVTFPDGTEQKVVSLARFCREHGLTLSCLHAVAKGKDGRKQHKGFRCRYAE